MRYSQLPLWRRVLIFVVTFAIVGAAYWVASLFAASVPTWVNGVLIAGFLVVAFIGIRRDNRLRREMEADGRLPKPRRDG